jgi:hypothetical protein
MAPGSARGVGVSARKTKFQEMLEEPACWDGIWVVDRETHPTRESAVEQLIKYDCVDESYRDKILSSRYFYPSWVRFGYPPECIEQTTDDVFPMWYTLPENDTPKRGAKPVWIWDA